MVSLYPYLKSMCGSKMMMNVLEIDNLILKPYLADVLTGCPNPPQGEMEMNLDWVRLFTFHMLVEKAKCNKPTYCLLLLRMTNRAPRAWCGCRRRCSSSPYLLVSCTWRSNRSYIPAVSIKACVLWCRTYAQRFLHN